MKFVRIFFSLSAVIILTFSCSRTNDRLLQAEQLIETSPDSAMNILRKYNYNGLSDKDKALYGMVFTRVSLSKRNILKSDSFISFSIDYFEKTNEKERIAASYFYKGRLYKYASDYETAMDYYLRSMDNISGLNDYKLLGRLNMDIGEIHFYQNNFISALDKFQKADSNFIKAGLQPQSFSCKMNIGRCYKAKEEYLTALNYNLNTMKFAQDLFQKGSVMQEIGINYYRLGKFDSALFYLKRVLDFPNYENNNSIRYYHLADLFFEIKQYDSAIYYSKRALQKKPDLRTRKECCRILVNCKTIKGDISGLNYYMSNFQDYDDSIRKIDLQTKGSYIETMHNTKKEAEKSRSWIWYLSVFILILISGGIYLYIRKHNKVEQVIEQSRVNHNREKAEIRKDIMLKKRETLFANIDRIKEEQKKSEIRAQNFALRIKNMYNELLHIQDTALFFCEMDGVLNNTVTKLKEVLPEISEKELTYCCLHLLKIPTHDILILLDYESVNSLKGMKRRLAQKLNLQNATLLNDFLLNLLSND